MIRMRTWVQQNDSFVFAFEKEAAVDDENIAHVVLSPSEAQTAADILKDLGGDAAPQNNLIVARS